MAIENNEVELSKVESHHNPKFHQELQAVSMADSPDKTNQEAARIREMLAANELMIEQIMTHGFQVADRCFDSIQRLPVSMQSEFMASIAKYNEPDDHVYHRVRQNYENSQLG